MQTRRDFLRALGISAVGATALSRVTWAEVVRKKPLPLGIQLYTLRALMEKDFQGTLAQVAAIGYKEVEFAGYYKRTGAEVRGILAKLGLRSPSSHIGLPSSPSSTDTAASDDAWVKLLPDAKTIGNQWAVVPWLDAKLRQTPEDWARFAERLNKLGNAAKKEGLKLAYHNHDFELATNGDGTWLDFLVQHTDPALVSFEMDVYWVTKGGGDPIAFLTKYPHRFSMLHLKDATAAPERNMVDVGSGTIDWKAVLMKARAQGATHAFVEHDKPTDALASARASHDYLARLKY